MLENNIQNNTQNETENAIQSGIQNVHQKFTARQNELRLYIINFTVDNKRSYNLESDKELALQALRGTGKLGRILLKRYEFLLQFSRI